LSLTIYPLAPTTAAPTQEAAKEDKKEKKEEKPKSEDEAIGAFGLFDD
jgi:ribosomal protein L12E/L44/L45/RPP1/RPP2